MSLTSTELNYLVWRYLQESGSELAAYALEKHSQCSSYEHNKNLEIIQRIEPGCLVNLVQKGILYSLAEYEAARPSPSPAAPQAAPPTHEPVLPIVKPQPPPESSILTLFGAILEDKTNEEYSIKVEKKGDEAAAAAAGAAGASSGPQGDAAVSGDGDVEMEDASPASASAGANAAAQQTTETGAPEGSAPASPSANDLKNGVLAHAESAPYTTRRIAPAIAIAPSITASWHPKTEVFAYGREDSLAVIVALAGASIAESVTLSHPTIAGLDAQNEISIVSWAPAGNIIVTSSINGELRAWSPDGKLKNIANTSTFQTASEHTNKSAAMVSSLIWSESGQYLLSIDINNQVCLWNGSNLNLIQQIRPPDEQKLGDAAAEGADDHADTSATTSTTTGTSAGTSTGTVSAPEPLPLIDACWLDENKFALSTAKNSIKIFAISSQTPAHSAFGGAAALPPLAKAVGVLAGHDHAISILKFNKASKSLASCSDFDYVIKIWHSNSLQHSVELNVNAADRSTGRPVHLHKAPIITLSWLDNSVLMSVSMDGVVNIWNVRTGEALVSSNLNKHFRESVRWEEAARESPDAHSAETANGHAASASATPPPLDPEQPAFNIFNAVVSANKKWLVLGDDTGRVSVWDVSLENYPQTAAASILRCLGLYELPADQAPAAADFGICDISWSSVSDKVCVSYKGHDSIVFDWQ